MPITVSGGMVITGGLSTLDAPALSLDFMSGTLDSRITFSRGTQATMVDSTGKLTYAPNNLLLNSQCDVGFVGNGTTPPTVTSTQVWQGISSTKITFTSSSAVGYAGSRADRVAVGSYQATVTAGYYYLGSNLISLSRALTGTESIVFYWTGTGGFNNFTITSANSTQYVNQWVRTTSIRTTPISTTGTVYPVVFLNGALSSNLDVYICNGQCEQTTYQTQPSTYVATTTTAYYGPRFGYDPISLQPLGLLTEASQRTNVVVPSNAVGTAYSGTTVTASAATGPDGRTSAIRISKTDATSPVYVGWATSMTVAATTTYTMSAYFKYDGYDTTVSLEYNSGGNFGTAWIAPFVVTGNGITAGSTSLCTSTVTNAGDGWYRCTATFTSGSAGSITLPTNPNILSRITGAAGVSVQAFGVQLEVGSFASSYIPTVASTVTRSADTMAMTGTNFSSWYNQGQGTFVISYLSPANPVQDIFGVNAGNFQNSIAAYYESSSQILFVRVSNVGQLTNNIISTLSQTSPVKLAIAYTTNDYASCGNGGTVQTNSTSASVPTVDRLTFANLNIQGNPFNGYYRSFEYYNTRIANSQLQGMSRV